MKLVACCGIVAALDAIDATVAVANVVVMFAGDAAAN